MKPILIIIDGPMGSGKSTISKLLQKKLKCALLSMDVIKKFIHDFQNAEKSSRKFAKYEITSLISRAYLKKGISVIIEQSLADSQTISNLIKKSKQKNIPFFVFKVDAPLKTRLQRVLKRDKNPLKKSKFLEDHESFNKSKFSYELEFNSEEEKIEEIVKKIVKKINK